MFCTGSHSHNLCRLVYDNNLEVQSHALNVIRNMACGKEPEIQDVYSGIGSKRLCQILDEKIACNAKDIVVQTIYIAVNFATGAKEHKEMILSCKRF
jgi:armadillo repeat-containing protein 8